MPLTFDATEWAPFVPMAGMARPVTIRCQAPGAKGKRAAEISFHEDLLFTHRGLSGPAILQISSYLDPEAPQLQINLVPDIELGPRLIEAKSASRKQLGTEFAQPLPQRLAATWLERAGLNPAKPIAECRDADLQRLGASVNAWAIQPTGDEGWRKAEVMRGGVSTRDLSSQTLESKRVPGLHFIGEVVDVTGWLGGYNFQWAWASAYACAKALAAAKK